MPDERERILKEIDALTKQNLKAIGDAVFMGWNPRDLAEHQSRLEHLHVLSLKLAEIQNDN